MRLMLVMMLPLFLVGCPAPAPVPGPNPVPAPGVMCSIEKALLGGAAGMIASPAALNCVNVSQMQLDIQAALGKANLCAPPALKGPVGDVVCPMFVNAVMGIGAGKIPAAWGCDTSATVANLSAQLSAYCSKQVGI